MRPPLNNETDESEATEVSSQTAASQEPITIITTFTSTLSIKINQPENKEENKEKEEFVKFLKGFTETRRQKYSEPFLRKPLDKSKVTETFLKSKKEEEFTSFSGSFTDSRRTDFSKPIFRKRLEEKNIEKKDKEPKISVKEENTNIKILVKMFNSLKNEPTISKEDRSIIKDNILNELQNLEKNKTSVEEAFENITSVVSNNTLTKEALIYLHKRLGGIIASQTNDDEALVQGADDSE